MQKSLSIIGTVGLPANYGGFETLVSNLVGCIDMKITVYCSSKSYTEKPRYFKDAKLIYIPISANGAQSIIYDIFSLIHVLYKRPEVVLILGVSGCIFLPFFRLLTNSKIVTNVDGIEWKREKWSTLPSKFLKFSELLAVKFSDEVIADNKAIVKYLKSEYNIDSSLISYGGDHAITSHLTGVDKNYALALCRIEPENNVELILESFSRSKMNLKFVGNWNVNEFAIQMKKKFAGFQNIELIDSIYDENHLFKLRSSCSFYVHGHSAGGTNPSLVEMMHFKKNIFCFDCIFNRETTENKAEFFLNSEQLIKLIERRELIDNASQMQEIALQKYSWDTIRNKYMKILY